MILEGIEELFESRHILKSMIYSTLFGRYKNSIIGFGWHFIIPLVTIIVYFIVFSQIRTNPIDDFWLYLASGIFPLNYMISSLSAGSGCIVNNAGMIKKMYFPREIIVLSFSISMFIILIIGLLITIIISFLAGNSITISLIILPFDLLLIFFFSTGCALLFSSLNVYHRDIQHLLNSITLFIFVLTPIFYLINSVDGLLNIVVTINPFTHYVELFHQSIYYKTIPNLSTLTTCIALSFTTFIVGLICFKKLKNGFVERL